MSGLKKSKAISIRYLFYDFVKFTSAIPGLIAFRPRYIYENENARRRIKGGTLLISNHMGFFDPVYIMFAIWYRRHRFICTKDFFESKAGWLFKGFLCIPIDKQNVNLSTFREIVEHLKCGELVSMFPEGTVSAGAQTASAFKSGMVLMALKSGCPIVPVYIKPRKHWYERVTTVIGEKIDIREMYGETPTFTQINAITALLHEKENKLVELC